jgi:hypothetical protein
MPGREVVSDREPGQRPCVQRWEVAVQVVLPSRKLCSTLELNFLVLEWPGPAAGGARGSAAWYLAT